MKRLLLMAGIGVWFLGIVTAMFALWKYKSTPGSEGDIPQTWPQTALARATGVTNVYLFAHPQCPCTKASMAELGHLAETLGPLARVHVVLVLPDGTDDDFANGAIAERARAIHADVYVDHAAVEAKRFGALTSGQTVVYDATGKLVFHGGITAARGHEGENRGSDRIVAIVKEHTRPDRADAPTFGCSIMEPELAHREAHP